MYIIYICISETETELYIYHVRESRKIRYRHIVTCGNIFIRKAIFNLFFKVFDIIFIEFHFVKVHSYRHYFKYNPSNRQSLICN